MDDYLKTAFVEQTSFYNKLLLPENLFWWLPHLLQSWVRNCVFATAVYLLTSFMCVGFWRRYFTSSPRGSYISKKCMLLQVGVTLKAMPYGALLPTGMEYMVEKGWTRCFPLITDVNFVAYLCYVLIYLAIVEVGIYLVHRLMHEVKPIYKHIHSRHHVYSKEPSLSPFAGWAVHPVEGILMGLPHGIATVIVPTHFTTHLALFLCQGVWGVLAHDRSQGMSWPLMGSEYHTVHHTLSHHNYGNFTIWMDQLFGTLRFPKD